MEFMKFRFEYLGIWKVENELRNNFEYKEKKLHE